MLTLTARIQQTPPDHRGYSDLPTDELFAEAGSYDQAMEQIKGQVPEGWRILWVRTGSASS